MDVLGKLNATAALIVAAIFVSGCQENIPEPQSQEFRNVSSQCVDAAIPNQFIVKWKDGSTSVEHAQDRAHFINEFMKENEGEIEFAEHDFIVHVPEQDSASVEAQSVSTAANDPYWGQTKIEADAAWNAGITGQGVIVAVIDSGVDITHPQISGQLAVNSREIPGNGIDDDGNGYIDDVNGYDFFDNSPIVKDGSGHGTHVSGIILADPTKGSAKGVAPGAKLLPLDFMNDEGAGSVSAAIEAIHYAVLRGAKVINASWGGPVCSTALRDAIAKLHTQGVLFVTAAGNSGQNLDYAPEFPAAFTSAAQITVGASTTRDAMAYFSNFSWTLTHIFAPGDTIFSTYPGGTKYLSGTSMAAPFVTGAVAALWSYKPSATADEIRAALFAGVDKDPSDPNGTLPSQTGGRLNLRKSLVQLGAVLP